MSQFPIHPEPVGEFAVGGARDALMKGHFYLTAGGEFFEYGVYLFVAAAIKAEDDRVSLLQACADQVRAHQQQYAVAGKTAAENIGPRLGGQLRGHRGLGYFLHAQFSAKTLLIEGHRFAAATVEIEPGVELGDHCASCLMVQSP